MKTKLLLLALLAATTARAQLAPAATPTTPAVKPAAAVPDEEDEHSIRMAAIEVSGERIAPFSSPSIDLPRTMNDAQAYYIFDARTIERSGAPTIENFIRDRLPMATNAISGDQSIFIGGTGSSINFRGIGAAQTLVLINGRPAPMANLQLNSQSPQPDINGIPLSAIDRIEVLPSSASGIYGGGAVGGVLNIILKRNFSGGEVKLNYQNTFDTDAPIKRVDFNYGFSLEKGRTSVMISASWADRELLTFGDRLDPLERYETGVYYNDLANPSPGTFLGTTPNIRSSTNVPLTLKPAFGGAALASSTTYIPFGTTASTPAATLAAGLLANAGKFNAERPDTAQTHGGLRGTLGTAPRVQSVIAKLRREFTPNLEIFGEFSHSGTANWRNLNSNLGIGTIPANSPFNPFVQALTLVMPITGDYPVVSNNLMRRVTVGAVAKLPNHWRTEVDYTWTTSNNSYKSTGFLASAELTAALAAGTLNPFVDTKLSPINLDRYNSTIVFGGGGSKNLIGLRAVGPLGNLPAGAVQLAFGLDHRRDGLTGGYHMTDYVNYPARNVSRYALGKDQISNGAYAELKLPLVAPAQNVPGVRLLELQLTGRNETYSVNTLTSFIQFFPVLTPPPKIYENSAHYRSTNPTIAARWQPAQGYMLRGSFSRGFAPPTYDQLVDNPDPSGGSSQVSDPRRGNTTYGGVATLSGGNPDLRPERSESKSVGLVLTPTFLKGFRFSADWSRIEKANNIGTLSLQQVIESEAVLPGRVTRGPVPAGDPYGVGPITLVDVSSLNLLRLSVESIDFSLGYRVPTERLGTFDVSALATVVKSFQRQLTAGQAPVEGVNFSTFGPLRRQGNATVTWDYRRWSAGWTARYIGSYRLSGPPVSTSTLSIVRQGSAFTRSQTFHEIFITHRFPRIGEAASGWESYLRGVELNLGVRNLFDFAPRMDASNVTYYYSTWGDIRMREYRFTLKKAF
ncbi:MAG: TonB-dependent receptor [Opitutus sp.]|nr:TonB-dependent receptor [Opitutus sp.]